MPIFVGQVLLLVLPALLALNYLLVFCFRGPSLLKSLTKTTSVLGLALAAWVWVPSPWLTIALGLCAIGDFALSREGGRWFLIGMVAFATGHLAYTYLFVVVIGTETITPLAWQTPIWAGLGIAALWLDGLFQPNVGTLKWPVRGYSIVILTMATVSLFVAGAPVLWAGALLFVLSDGLIGADRFTALTVRMPRWVLAQSIWVTYWLGQFFIFLGVAAVL